MNRSPRLSAEERRTAIINASRAVFSVKGCDAATTRELAEAAGVSEALLYKHFPSKESLFRAMCEGCKQSLEGQEYERLTAMAPCTESLIGLVRLTIGQMVGPSWCWSNYRLYLRSLVENGEFARNLMRDMVAEGKVQHYADCLRAADRAGDRRPGALHPDLGFWFVQHFCTGLMSTYLSTPPAIQYSLETAEVVQQACTFALSGLGFTDQAVLRCPPSNCGRA